MDAVPFASILFDRAPASLHTEKPDFFEDLHLDQLVAQLVSGQEDLAPFFYTAASDLKAVTYRQEVAKDLERDAVRQAVQAFCSRMAAVEGLLGEADGLFFAHQRAARFLEAALSYTAAAAALASDLASARPVSSGFSGLLSHLEAHVGSAAFSALASDAQQLKKDVSAVQYTLRIGGKRITVDRFKGEADLGQQVLATFEKFRQAGATDFTVTFTDHPALNRVEAGILDLVARLFPEPMAALAAFPERHAGFSDPTLTRFAREVPAYLRYLEVAEGLKKTGLPFCYPELTDTFQGMDVAGLFDMALAVKLADEGKATVGNDVFLSPTERIVVVTGPNQGGKTTFARAFGQLCHLARLGLPVPAKSARVLFSDQIFTHFEREEHLADLRGKLKDELVRLRSDMSRATDHSLLIMNETFSSTTVRDAAFLGEKILEALTGKRVLCLFVTFVDELSTLNDAVVSMVSTTDPASPAKRTFKLVRKPADGLAYALSVAAKHRLTYDQVKARLMP